MIKSYKKIIILLILTSCFSNNISNKGYVLYEEDLSNIKIGLSNQEYIIKTIGYPYSKSYFNKNIWYYYTYKKQKFLFFKPIITKQNMLILEFDPNTQIIKNKIYYNIKNNNDINITTFNKSITTDDNILNDIFKNIGQIKLGN